MPQHSFPFASSPAARRVNPASTAVVYCRVSTQDQAENGVSLEVQQVECERFAREKSYTIPADGVFIERGESAKTIEKRPVLLRLLRYCQEHHPAAVIIYNSDRISRNLEHHGVLRYSLRAWGVQLLAVQEQHDESAAGRMTTNLLAAISQFDNDLRSEKTTKAMQHLEAQGYWLHREPNGYRFEDEPGTPRRVLVPDGQASSLIRKAFEMMATGQFTQQEVRDQVTMQGLRLNTGRAYSAQAFWSMMRNPVYAGLIPRSWGGEPVRGRHKGLVSHATFLRVQDVLAERALITQRRAVERPEFPLRRFVRCGRTGRTFTGGFCRGKSGKKYGYYFPYRYPPGSQNVRAEVLEAAFLSFLAQFEVSAVHRPAIEATLRALWAERHASGRKEREEAQGALKRLRAEQTQLTRKLAQGTLTDAAYGAASSTVSEEIRHLEDRAAMLPAESLGEDKMIATCLNWIEHLSEAWKRGGYAEKQRLQALLFPLGVIFENGVVRTPKTAHLLAVIGAVRDVDSSWAAPRQARLNTRRRHQGGVRKLLPKLVMRLREQFSADCLLRALRDMQLLVEICEAQLGRRGRLPGAG